MTKAVAATSRRGPDVGDVDILAGHGEGLLSPGHWVADCSLSSIGSGKGCGIVYGIFGIHLPAFAWEVIPEGVEFGGRFGLGVAGVGKVRTEALGNGDGELQSCRLCRRCP